MAFAAAVGAAKVAGPLLNFAISTKKATDVLAEMKELPGEGYVLWKMMQCTSAPLNICTELAARHETHALAPWPTAKEPGRHLWHAAAPGAGA